MRKPATIILTLVGTAVAGGVGLTACSRRTSDGHTSHRSNALPVDQVILEKDYANDSYIAGVGYYNAPYFGWFPYKYNFHDSTRGYFHGGNWTPQANAAVMASSKPSPAAIALARDAYLKANPTSSSYRGSSYRSSGLHSTYGGGGIGTMGGHGSTSFTSTDSTGSHTTGGSNVSSVSHGGFGGSAHSSGS